MPLNFLRFSILFSLLLAGSFASAQRLAPHQHGFEVHLNLSTDRKLFLSEGRNPSIFESADFGFNAGYVYYWNFSKKAALRSGLSFRYLRERFHYTDGSQKETIFLRIPVELHWRLTEVIALEIGPGVNFLVHDANDFPNNGLRVNFYVFPETNTVSLDGKLGLRFQLVSGLDLGLSFIQGLSPVYKDPNAQVFRTKQAIVFGSRFMF